jgi:hypothetical protein
LPYSNRDNEAWVAEKVRLLKPATTLDVGPGAGAYGALVAGVLPEARRDAIEIWAPYIEQFKLLDVHPVVNLPLYHNVMVCDARIFPDYDYDLVFFGDVLEHMTESESRALWARVSMQARAAIISLPIIHYPQGPHEGNPYEAHVEEDWTTERVLSTFPFITDHIEFDLALTDAEMDYHQSASQVAPVSGTYLAEF